MVHRTCLAQRRKGRQVRNNLITIWCVSSCTRASGLFICVLMVLALTACAASSPSRSPITTLTVLSYPDRPAKLPLWLAQDAGLFKKYGLNVEIKNPNSGEAIAEGARNNVAEIYVATANWLVSAIGDGADLVFFANTGYSVLKFVARPEFTRVEQLKGKRIGTGEPNSSQDRITRQTLQRLGLNPDRDVTLVPFGSRSALRLAGGHRSFGLLDLIGELPLLQTQRGLALANLRRDPLSAVFEVGAFGPQLPGIDLGDGLAPFHFVAFLDQERHQSSADLRRHADVVGGDDAGQHERLGREREVVIRAVADNGDQDEDGKSLGHGLNGMVELKHMYKTIV